jgi:hypothetical protein
MTPEVRGCLPSILTMHLYQGIQIHKGEVLPQLMVFEPFFGADFTLRSCLREQYEQFYTFGL